MNTASTSGSRTLPSNTITNPREDLKGITTQSGVAYKGPTIPTTSSYPKVVEHETEVTKDTVPPTNNGSTKDVQPPVVQVETQVPNSEPIVAPVVEPVKAPVSSAQCAGLPDNKFIPCRIGTLQNDRLLIQPVAPPSPDYIPGPEDPQTPPVPQDEDEPEEQPLPPVDLPTAESPEYVTESDPKEDPEEYKGMIETGGWVTIVYPIDGGDDGDDDNGDSSRDDANDKDEDEDEEDKEEEEHLAPTDSIVIVPTDEPVSQPEGTELVIPPPSTDITIRARISIRP
ncbi:hypothetical protein Tco_1312576 [Tanacetum coccineum]